MNNTRSFRRIKTLVFICTLLALTSCGKDIYVVIVVTATPAEEIVITPPNPIIPVAPVSDFGDPLKVTWNIPQRCTTGGELKDGTVELKISGGALPYDISPKPPFSIGAGQVVEVTVKSQDGQTWVGKIPAPTCEDNSKENNAPAGGKTPKPETKPTSPTPNPNHP